MPLKLTEVLNPAPITMDEFQQHCVATSIAPTSFLMATSEQGVKGGSAGAYALPFLYHTLGLTGEAGEVAEAFKKAIRSLHRGEPVDYEKVKQDVALELGDVLYYVSMVAHTLGLTLNDIADANFQKRMERYPGSCPVTTATPAPQARVSDPDPEPPTVE